MNIFLRLKFTISYYYANIDNLKYSLIDNHCCFYQRINTVRKSKNKSVIQIICILNYFKLYDSIYRS